MSGKWRRIFTVNEYYDGPVLGVAEFRDALYVYERQWDPALNRYGELFRLAPIEPDLLALVLEDWEIWLRWDSALKRGEADEESHPALPDERQRHREIQEFIGDRLESKRDGSIKQFGTLKFANRQYWVRWSDKPLHASRI